MVPERLHQTSRRSFQSIPRLYSASQVMRLHCERHLAGLAIYFNLSTFTGVCTSARCLVHPYRPIVPPRWHWASQALISAYSGLLLKGRDPFLYK